MKLKSEVGCETGIYKITNQVNGKIWIGQAQGKLGLLGRYKTHKAAFRKRRNSPRLQASWNKHGEDSFVFEVVLTCPRDWCNKLEDFFLNKFESWDPEKGYNISKKSWGPGALSEETKLKMSISRKGKKRKEEAIERSAEWHRGKKRSDETRKRISEAMTGKVVSEERRRTHREAMQRPEVRRKLSESRLGKKSTGETKERISRIHKGRKRPESTGKKISDSLKGRIISEETRTKLSLINKGKQVSQEEKDRLRGLCNGRVWMNKAGQNKRALQEEVHTLLEKGWVLGRI
jgi:group I intron endonuclease